MLLTKLFTRVLTLFTLTLISAYYLPSAFGASIETPTDASLDVLTNATALMADVADVAIIANAKVPEHRIIYPNKVTVTFAPYVSRKTFSMTMKYAAPYVSKVYEPKFFGMPVTGRHKYGFTGDLNNDMVYALVEYAGGQNIKFSRNGKEVACFDPKGCGPKVREIAM